MIYCPLNRGERHENQIQDLRALRPRDHPEREKGRGRSLSIPSEGRSDAQVHRFFGSRNTGRLRAVLSDDVGASQREI